MVNELVTPAGLQHALRLKVLDWHTPFHGLKSFQGAPNRLANLFRAVPADLLAAWIILAGRGAGA